MKPAKKKAKKTVVVKVSAKKVLKSLTANEHKCPPALWRKMSEATRWNYNNFMDKTSEHYGNLSIPKLSIREDQFDIIRHNLAVLYLL